MDTRLEFDPEELELIRLALQECSGHLRQAAYSPFLRPERVAVQARAEAMDKLARSIAFTGQAQSLDAAAATSGVVSAQAEAGGPNPDYKK